MGVPIDVNLAERFPVFLGSARMNCKQKHQNCGEKEQKLATFAKKKIDREFCHGLPISWYIFGPFLAPSEEKNRHSPAALPKAKKVDGRGGQGQLAGWTEPSIALILHHPADHCDPKHSNLPTLTPSSSSANKKTGNTQGGAGLNVTSRFFNR